MQVYTLRYTCNLVPGWCDWPCYCCQVTSGRCTCSTKVLPRGSEATRLGWCRPLPPRPDWGSRAVNLNDPVSLTVEDGGNISAKRPPTGCWISDGTTADAHSWTRLVSSPTNKEPLAWRRTHFHESTNGGGDTLPLPNGLRSCFSYIQTFLCFLLTRCHGERTHVCSGGSVPPEPELD